MNAQMKKRTKWICVLLAVVVMAGHFVNSPSAVVDDETPYEDVNEGDWYYDAVMYLDECQSLMYAYRYYRPTKQTFFAPMEPASRAVFVQTLSRMHGVNTGAFTQNGPDFSKYIDISSDQPIFQCPNLKTIKQDVMARVSVENIIWADFREIVNGIGGSLFDPNGNLTREQMATIIVRYLNEFFPDSIDALAITATDVVSEFKDAKYVSSWAVNAIEQCRRMGILHGDDRGYVNPQQPLTRAEMAVVIANLRKAILPWLKEIRPSAIKLECKDLFIDQLEVVCEPTLFDADSEVIAMSGLCHYYLRSVPNELNLDFDPATGRITLLNVDKISSCDAEVFSDELLAFLPEAQKYIFEVYCVSDFDYAITDKVFVSFYPYTAAAHDAASIPTDSYCNRVQAEFFRLMNEERAAQGLSPVIYAPELQKAVDIRADELVTKMSHVRPNGTSPDTVLNECGIRYSMCGENIMSIPTWGLGTVQPETVAKNIFNSYKQSPGHYQNMMYAGTNLRGATQIYYIGILYNAYLFYAP